MVGYNLDPEKRKHVMKLMEEKQRIENLIKDNYAVLETNNVGLKDSLVDALGYPRNDINVYEVRHARHNIIRFQNDHKSVMQLIEKGISNVYEDLIADPNVNNEERRIGVTSHPPTTSHEVVNHQTFAIITLVDVGSPADEAGLRTNDEIVEFGTINDRNYKDITQIMRIVSNCVNSAIRVVVRRGDADLTFELVPKRWAKPGLIGCKIQTKVNNKSVS